MGIKEKFKRFDKPDYYSRVEPSHPLEIWYGLDNHSRKTIELRANFKHHEVKGTDSIEINQYSKKEYKTISFSLKNDEMVSLFYTFCDDLIENTRTIENKEDGYVAIINRYLQWKKLFTNNHKDLLSEAQIMGLIGEILFFKDRLCNEIGAKEALKSWSGQDLTHKDFSYGDLWYEIKAISNGKKSVRISSLEQLDSKYNGFLIVYALEKMSPAFDGISLNKLILDTLKKFSVESDKDCFLDKASAQGYTYNDYYNQFVFDVKDCLEFEVTDEFPKLTKQSIPFGITRVSYELSIMDISKFRLR